MDLKELREARAKAARNAKDLVEKHPKDWSPALQKQYEGFVQEIDATDAQLARYQAVLDRTADDISGGRGYTTGSVPGDVRAALRGLAQYVRTGDVAGMAINNSLTEDPSSAGALVPYELDAELQRMALPLSPLRGICRVKTIGTTASRYTTPILTSGAGASWVGETDARTETTVPTIAGIVYPDSEIEALIPISQWATEDTELGQIIVEELGRAFGRTEGAAFVRGTGVKQPKGILTCPIATTPDATRPFETLMAVPSAGNTVASSDLVNLIYSLLPEYRVGAYWVMTTTTLGVVRNLKDTVGRFLWQEAMVPGQPATLLGFPICEANDWDNVGTGLHPVAFGNFQRGYTIVDRATSILRDPYSQKPFVQIYGRKRVSGNLVDSNAIRLLQMSA